jgi:site-specific recombinase XerD
MGGCQVTEDRDRLAALTWTVAPETTLTGALAAFLTDCEARRLSPKTLIFYHWQIDHFADWLRERGISTLDAVGPAEIRGYLVHLQGRGMKDTTQHAAARAVRAWFAWLEREELITRSPMRKVGMPKVDKRILPALGSDDLRRLLAACGHARDRLIILALLDTGCRAAEFVALDIGDVDLTSGRIMVRHGKGGKDRITWLGERTRRMLAAYLDLERPDAGPYDPLFTSFPNASKRTEDGRLTVVGLQQALQRIGERAGVKNCHPHTFRRTCALLLHRNGARLTEIAALLGHSDLPTLQRYLDLQDQDAEDAHRRHGPVDTLGL